MLKTALSFVAMACSLSSGTIYLVSMVKGRARPQRITWLLWSILGAVYLLSALRSHGNVIYTTASFIGPFSVLALSVKYGVGGKSKLDLLSLAIALFALALLAFTKSPIASLLICLFVDAIGAALTVRKVLRDRSSEPRITWLISACGGAFALLGLRDYQIANLLFPGYIVILGLLTFSLVRPRRA